MSIRFPIRSLIAGCLAMALPAAAADHISIAATLPLTGTESRSGLQYREGYDLAFALANAKGGLRVSVQPGGCSGFKYGLLIEDEAAEDDVVVDQGGWRVFVDPFSAQYLNGVTIDYVTSMMGSGFTFKNPNATGGCGCGSSFSA